MSRAREVGVGRVHPAAWLALATALAAAGLIALLLDHPVDAQRPLVAYTAASLRPPMEEIAAEYRRKTGRRVELRFGGSEEILAQARVSAGSNPGDLFLPADDSYVRQAEVLGLTAEALPLARQRAVVLVARGKSVGSWADLTRDGARLALAEPGVAAIGLLTRDHLRATGRWDDLDRRVVVRTDTVTQSANAVKVGSVDAAVVWDTVARQYPDLTTVRLPELDGIVAKVAVAVLRQSPDPAAAAAFARFVADPDGGLPHFRAAGFEVGP